MRGEVKPADDIVLSEDQIIEALEDNKLYTYLGMAQREDCIDSLIKETVKKENLFKEPRQCGKVYCQQRLT